MSGAGSYQSTSLSSSRSKSLDSSEGLSHSGTFSSPEIEAKLSSGTIGSSSGRSKGSDSWRNSEFPLKTLGILKSATGFGEGSLDIINAVDVAQQEEQLSFLADGDEVYISVTSRGIRIMSANAKIVKHRLPLHTVERMVTFDDGICGNTLLALKVVESEKNETIHSLWVYQCPNDEAGQKITQSFSHVLAKVLSSQSSNNDITLKLKDERCI